MREGTNALKLLTSPEPAEPEPRNKARRRAC